MGGRRPPRRLPSAPEFPDYPIAGHAAIVAAMPSPAVTLEVLPAGYGDCLLVSCPVGRRTWRLLVDTGPDETYPALKSRLAQIPPDREGRRHIDLFIVSHIDHDHIGGAALLLADRELNLSFGDVWFNAPPRPKARGVAEGEGLATLLGAPGNELPWNLAFDGGTVCTGGDGQTLEVRRKRGEPRITLLSPTPARLEALFKVWDRELERLRRKQHSEEKAVERAAPRGVVEPTLEELATRDTRLDKAEPNGSSIAVLLEHRGASVILGADAFATVMGPALRQLAQLRGTAGALGVDVLKLSHHGSSANVTRDLFDAVQAKHYVFSTSGAIFDHPDDEAVARTILLGGRGARVWFNYRNPRKARWSDPATESQYGFTARLPDDPGGGGVTIRLPSP